MSTLASILFWTGIVLMFDGALGLLFQEKWKKLVEGLDVPRMALIEISVALVLLAAHFLILLNAD